ncbi:hypothetical protein SRHO_G00198630 [Serrasalmus rhombeus]
MVTLREASMLPCPPCCEEPAACFISGSRAPGITPQGLPPLRQGRRAGGRCGQNPPSTYIFYTLALVPGGAPAVPVHSRAKIAPHSLPSRIFRPPDRLH